MSKKIVVLTGATGFVGGAIAGSIQCKELRLISRRDPKLPNSVFCEVFDYVSSSYKSYLANCDVVIHAAARVHVMNDMSNDPLREYRLTNVEGTVNLAKQSAAAGVRRFIYISSIKVNGDSTTGRLPFKYDDIPNPNGPYAVSKFEAEERLKEICFNTGMEFVIIRPPLIYGYGVKANFSAMLSLARKNLPLPLGGIKNRRSLLALDNFTAMIEVCMSHVNAKNQTFLVSDDNDISTSELLRAMTKSYGKNPRLLSVPKSWIVMLGNILGKKDIVDRLCGDLHIDIGHTKLLLEWKPHVLIEDVLRELH